MLQITPTRLNTMLELQDTLNQRVNPNWLQAHYPWHRAAWLEAAELVESIGWKWWKKQTPDLDNVKIEIVDLWHFALSHALQLTSRGNAAVLDQAAGYLAQELAWTKPTLDPLDHLDQFIGECSFKRVPAGRIIALATFYEISDDDFYNAYVAKNLLNIFRQDNGYKAGTYIKQWREDGAEDNTYVTHLLQTMPDATPAVLLGEMATQYAKVVASKTAVAA